MSENLENRLTSTQAKDAIYKAHSIGSSASEIDVSVNQEINVKNYGAIPDYSGIALYDGLDNSRITATDNTTAFTLALLDAKSKGSNTIFVPRGHYGFKVGNINFSDFDSITIRGEDKESTILDFIKEDLTNSTYVTKSVANSIFKFENIKTVTLSDITIKGTTKYGIVDDSLTQGAIYYGAVWGVIFDGCDYINVTNAHVERFNYRGMAFYNFKTCIVSNCSSIFNVGSGFWAEDGDLFEVYDSDFSFSGIKGFYNSGYGVTASTKVNTFIASNVYAHKNFRKGIDSHGCNTFKVTNCILEDNVVYHISHTNVQTYGDTEQYLSNNTYKNGYTQESKDWIDEAHTALIASGYTVGIGNAIDINLPANIVTGGVVYMKNNKILSAYSGLSNDVSNNLSQEKIVRVMAPNCSVHSCKDSFMLSDLTMKDNGNIYVHSLYQYSAKNLYINNIAIDISSSFDYIDTVTSTTKKGMLFEFILSQIDSNFYFDNNNIKVSDGYIHAKTSGGNIAENKFLSTHNLSFKNNSIIYSTDVYTTSNRMNVPYFFCKEVDNILDYSFNNSYKVGSTFVKLPKRLSRSFVQESISTGKAYTAGSLVCSIYIDRVYVYSMKIDFGINKDALILNVPLSNRSVNETTNNSLLTLDSYEDVIVDGILMQKINVKSKGSISSTIAVGRIEADFSSPSLGIYKIILA